MRTRYYVEVTRANGTIDRTDPRETREKAYSDLIWLLAVASEGEEFRVKEERPNSETITV